MLCLYICLNEETIGRLNGYFYNIDMICEKYWYWLIYVFIEFIISIQVIPIGLFSLHTLMIKKKSFTFYIQLILKYICFKEFWIINKSKILEKNVFVNSKMLPNLFYRIIFVVGLR
jgi:hypothetical protein